MSQSLAAAKLAQLLDLSDLTVGNVQGNLTGALAVLKGTPTTYNKDNQEVWELLFSTLDTMNDTVGIATGVLSTLSINAERMRSGLSADMLATDLAEYLVRKVCWCKHDIFCLDVLQTCSALACVGSVQFSCAACKRADLYAS